VEVLHGGGAPLACCGENMKLMAESVGDGAKEKHVPVLEKTADGFTVSVGAVAHPMEEAHHIAWVELLADGKSYRQFLHPGDAPKAHFPVKSDHAVAREYCNLHGHWKAEI
jgi:superoxide reductase